MSRVAHYGVMPLWAPAFVGAIEEMNRSESSVEFAHLAGRARGRGCGGSSRGRSDKAEAALYSNVKLLLETAGFAVNG